MASDTNQNQTIVTVPQETIISVLRNALANCVELQNMALNNPEGTDDLIDLYESEKQEVNKVIGAIDQ